MIMETLRTSSYMIPVKLENEEGKYMLVHGYTGAIDIVSEDLLNRIRNVSSAIEFSEKTKQALLKRGYITAKTPEEEYAYVMRMAKALHRECDILSTSFTWVVSYNCNFRCPYCFEGKEMKDGEEKLVFTKERVDMVYEAQDKIQPCRELRKNIITLYGGEPLLAENKEIVSYIVEEGRKRGYKFVAVTNGYEIEHFLNLLGEDGIYRLQITIDGPRNMHNQRRIHYKGYDTFDKIVENIKLALDCGTRVVVRMNSDGKNIEQYDELREYFAEKKYFDYPNFSIYLARLRDYYDVSHSGNEKVDFLSPQSFHAKRNRLKAIPFSQDTGYYKIVYESLVEKRAMPFRPIACKSQSGEYVFDSLGNIYPCWEVIGKKEYIKGVYSKDGIAWNKNNWKQSDVTQIESCRHCKYALFCGGGCPYHRMLNEGKLQCVIFKDMFNSAINKAYADLNNNYLRI